MKALTCTPHSSCSTEGALNFGQDWAGTLEIYIQDECWLGFGQLKHACPVSALPQFPSLL